MDSPMPQFPHKAVGKLNALERKLFCNTLGIYIQKPNAMFYINAKSKPTKWQSFKVWLKHILKMKKLETSNKQDYETKTNP